jgi:mRNA interferase HigB
MHIITRRRLTQFWKKYKDSEGPLRAWHSIVEKKNYANSHEVKADFPSTDFLGSGLTVFDIGGNKYRLVALMRYRFGRVFIRHILTHAEYDKLLKAKKL